METEEVLDKRIFLIVIRYIILLIIALSSSLIYKILAPLTIYSVAGLLKLVYPVIISGTLLLVNASVKIDIIPACVAVSAYLLLLILNLFIEMKPKQRIYSILLSFGLLFLFNVLRIFILSILLVNGFEYFDLTHKFVWYFLSTVFVIIIWLLVVKVFSIRKIPIVSDVKYFIRSIKQ